MKTSKRRSGAACSPRSWDELPGAVWRWTHGAGDPLSHPQTPCSSPACRECAHRLWRERTRRATVWSSAASSPCKISLSLPCWSLQQHRAPLNKAPCNPSEVLLPIHAPQELCLSTKSLKPSPNHLISISATSLSSVTFLLTTASVGFQITPSHPYLQEEFSCCPGTVLTQQKGHARQAPGGSRKGWKSSSVPAAHLNPHQHLWFRTKNNLQHIQMPKQRSLTAEEALAAAAPTSQTSQQEQRCYHQVLLLPCPELRHPPGSVMSLRSRQSLPEHPVLPTQNIHLH